MGADFTPGGLENRLGAGADVPRGNNKYEKEKKSKCLSYP